jgi:peptide/nickel transport system ATP-binding protein
MDSDRGEPLSPIRGSINDMVPWEHGCAFAPRCDRYELACLQGTPELVHLPGSNHQHRCVNPAVEHSAVGFEKEAQA